ncbi:MAG: S1C family serine protease [Patescibacteria group bacterium]
MDVQELNKSQLIMLALLLSFVTSIATGITTVTLMQQAPSSVTVPINRIIKQTVEKIVPGQTINTVQTVVIKEEDLVIDAIAKNQTALFSLSKEGLDETGQTIETGEGKGLIVSAEGIVVVDAALVPNKGVYYVKNSSGKFKADFVSTNKSGFSFLKIGAPLDEKNKLTFTVPSFGDLSKMKAGQKVIVLGSSISAFIFDGASDLKLSGTKSNAGAPVLDLDGNVLGIALSGDASFVSISTVINALKEALTPPKVQ